MIKNLTFTASDNERIAITAYLEEKTFTGNSIFFVHGFKGFKDWGFGPFLAGYFASRGYFTVTFNFSHNGIGDDSFKFDSLDKFAKNTISREVRELNELLDAARAGFFDEIERNTKIGILGHSRGGAVSILAASKRNDVQAVAVWAAISKLDRYSERQKAEWRQKGFFEVLNTRTNQLMKLSLSLLEDIETNAAGSLNLEYAVKNLNKPLFIAHGDQDLAVPIEEGEQIYEWSDTSWTEFYKIFGTGHTFDVVHPFEGTNSKFDRLLEQTGNFFNKTLK